MSVRAGLFAVALLAAGPLPAATPSPAEAFIAAAFDGAPPAPTLVWYDPRRRETASTILGHPPATARVRVWRDGARSAVVLDEVPHSFPITAGFVVVDRRIERARVLVYRETRGGAVQRAEWLAQFEGHGLRPDLALDGPVDGITGATLSVAAMTRMARLAIYLADEASHPAAATRGTPDGSR